MDKWRSVTNSNPCPICHKPDWCGRSEDGFAVICMRAENDYPTKNGGYLYVFREGAWRTPEKRLFDGGMVKVLPPLPKAPKIAPKWANQRRRLTTEDVSSFIAGDTRLDGSESFGVREICGEDGFVELCTAWSFGLYESKSHPNCAGIIMRNAGGDAVGVRFRNVLTKAKTSLYGGSDGLFFDWTIFKRKVSRLFVVEGASDAICLASLGFDVVGRSSCSTGSEMIRQLINIINPRDIVYVSDNDNAKIIAGRLREAGRDGAIKLAKAVGKPFKLISPLNCKDIRDYILNLRNNGSETPQICACIMQMVNDALIRR